MSELLETTDSEPITAEEAKEWFEHVYLSRFANARLKSGGAYERKTDWAKAKELKNDKGQAFVWAPVSYATEKVPALLNWTDETAYKSALVKYYVQPIVEGLVVVKDKGKNEAFLCQIAYDPYDIRSKGKLDFSTFTGWLIRADWNDTIIAGAAYKSGKQLRAFDKRKEKGARPALCYYETVEYVTVEGHSCGPGCDEVTVTRHTYTQVTCSGAFGSGDFGGGGAGNYYGPGFDSTSGGGLYQDSSSFGYNFIPRNYNLNNAINNPASSDRRFFNKNIEDALFATGLATNIGGWSLDKAEALAKSVGGNVKAFKGLIDGVGVAGIIIDGVQLGISLSDGKEWDEEDTVNAIQLFLGVAGLATGGGIAVGLGVVSVGIAILAKNGEQAELEL